MGIVSTADLEDTTPAAFAVHPQNRAAGTGIVDQYLDEAVPKANLTATSANATKLIGLFHPSNMNTALDKIAWRRGRASPVTSNGYPDQPMLDEMTKAALAVLAKNPNGFVLMIEAGSIDKQAHAMDTDRWLVEILEFDRAIERVRQLAVANPDTLALVTADHETGGVSIVGASTLSAAALKTLATTAATSSSPLGRCAIASSAPTRTRAFRTITFLPTATPTPPTSIANSSSPTAPMPTATDTRPCL